MIDLDGYFARIGYTGPRRATLETLGMLHALHPAAIPFENLDPLLGRPVLLDLGSLQDKLVRRRRGGYCFEQNTLFRAALEALGFGVTSLAARVLWGSKPGRPHPRTHMLLLVHVDGRDYIADVGFGGRLMATPLQRVPGLEQPTQHGMMRLVEHGMFLTLQAASDDGWEDLYRFTLEPQFPIDQETANWFTATHPDSLFRHNLLMERLAPDLRCSLFNRRLTQRYPDGRVSLTQLADAAALRRVLTEAFALDVPAKLDAVFARLPAG
ncbi:MAG TPA: arylamine N-acetyltransferase [Acetobacteraceae bacterium]|nr:arylamine N-acetyltransferase [Acetobacteraceae bacterium]